MSGPSRVLLRVGFRTGLAAGLCLLLTGAAGAAQGGGSVAAPFVGCAADGQGGPVAAPKRGATPKIPAASGLTYYVSGDIGVLAPRGWNCFDYYGSSGSTLFVTPERHGSADLANPDLKFAGPAVVLSHISGGTSGRFDAAEIAARLFPAARSFVQGVIAEGIEPKEDFVFAPYPADALTRRSATVVEFATPASSDGLGTVGLIVKNDQPISGVVILLPASENDLINLAVRLPPEAQGLASVIVSTAEQNKGAP
ncbi:MAG TPA: hypothetical protein VKS78_16290 [Roseiarcus sp.]|nr:hypothetical protein [Roseiarcus sp.]